MAMSAQAMCDAIKAEYDAVTESVDWESGERAAPLAYVEAFDKGLCNYTEENMVVTYDWKAALPAPPATPDPTTSFTSELVIEDKTIGQPATVGVWGSLIMACFAKAKIKHPSGFSVPLGTLVVNNPPLVIIPPPGAYPGPLLGICTQIYAWLNPAPLSGPHGPYTGATTGMAIA
jgi:hypothetical protein